MDVAPNFFEQLVRFLMMLLGILPAQNMTTQAACVEADYGRPVFEMTFDRADALLPNDLYTLSNVQFDSYNAYVFYTDYEGSLIGGATMARPCVDSGQDWDDIFNDEWFAAVYPTYSLQKQRRCIYENTTLVEYAALTKADETPFVLRYYYEPVSDVRVNIVQYTFPESRQDELNDSLRLIYPQLVTCNVTP